DRQCAEDPDENAGQESHEGPERDLDVGIRTARHVDAAAGLGEAERDQPHDRGADQIGDRRARSQRCGDAGRKTKDAAADGDVDDTGGQPPGTDGPQERALPGWRGHHEVMPQADWPSGTASATPAGANTSLRRNSRCTSSRISTAWIATE